MFMESKIESLSSKEKLISKVNPKMAWFTTRLTRLSKKYSETKDPAILKELKILRKERNTLPSRIRQGNTVRTICRRLSSRDHWGERIRRTFKNRDSEIPKGGTLSWSEPE
jgi:hypothetical protein